MKIVLTIFLLTITLSLHAQTELGKMSVDGKPMPAPPEEMVVRRLPDGRFCAAIKVLSELDNFAYDSEIGVVKYDDLPGQDMIYLNPNDRFLTLYHVGYEPLRIIFSEISIQLKQKQVWELKIKGSDVNFLPVSFVLTPGDALVKIDGKDMGSGPTFQLNTGPHIVNISQKQHYPKQDTITVTPNNVIFSYHLAVKPAMVLVEGGTFDMGKDGIMNAEPVHKVSLNNFYLSKYEVTFAEYDAFCNATKHDMPADLFWGRDDRPVINVSWNDAIEFCNWLSEQEGLKPCYTIDKIRQDPNNGNEYDNVKWIIRCDFNANGYRLPTEAEWEYACRGGRHSAHYKYSGSNDVDAVAWYGANSGGKTHPVAKKKPNELGIYDMSGNIFEWCWDPTGPEKGDGARFKRGGTWLVVCTLWR